MNDKAKIALIFWTHFVIAAASHIFVLLMIGGLISLVSSATVDFWQKGLLFGITFYTGMYAVNHVTNEAGFCVMTDLENFYRKQAQLPTVGPFTPRFYKKCRQISIILTSKFRRKKV